MAVMALQNLAANNDDDARIDIARKGGVTLFLDLLKIGTDRQKEYSTHALTVLAQNDEVCAQISREGGIHLLIGLLQNGSTLQKGYAAGGIDKIAFRDDNRLTIAQEGGIANGKRSTTSQPHDSPSETCLERSSRL
ncbi:hypothetical protein PC121_g16580 [Phytophthora cactorum]|nr:hypothetical protein PC121_g16580 [Phytophthora cactorum]